MTARCCVEHSGIFPRRRSTDFARRLGPRGTPKEFEAGRAVVRGGMTLPSIRDVFTEKNAAPTTFHDAETESWADQIAAE